VSILAGGLKAVVPVAVRQTVRRQRELLRDARRQPALAILRTPLAGELTAASVPVKRPPVLVTSLPRSGSSWIGGILGMSGGALYLREPMTQTYLKRFNQRGAPFFEWSMCRAPEVYARAAADAFRGLPRFGAGIVLHPQQWSLRDRKARRVVIKDVNPLVLDRLRRDFNPKIILLVRHPVAVARSFHALGWTADQFVTRLSPDTLRQLAPSAAARSGMDFWEQIGSFQAIAQTLIAQALPDEDHMVMHYEDVCRDPQAAFAAMFAFAGLPADGTTAAEITRSSQGRAHYRPGGYDTARNSRTLFARWREEVDPDVIATVRRGYFAGSPRYYTEAGDM
jgi:hypothetical protein